MKLLPTLNTEGDTDEEVFEEVQICYECGGTS